MAHFTFRSSKRDLLLVTFFASNLIGFIDEWLWMSDAVLSFPHLVNIYLPFLYVLGPTFYLYVKSLTHEASGSKFSYFHFSGFIIAVLLCSPYYALDWQTKLERLKAPSGTLEHMGIHTYGPVLALIFLLIFSLTYLLFTIRLLNQHLINVKSFFSNIENRDLSWIRWSVFLIFLAASVSILQVALPSTTSDSKAFMLFFLAFELGWLVLFGSMAIEQKSILVTRAAEGNSLVETIIQPLEKKTKYERSGLGDAEMTRLGDKIMNKMETQKLYLDPDLTLRKLSISTGVAEANLSQVLNVFYELGFYDFVNKLRIEYSVELMKTTNNNLLDIAMTSGFNSRSTFNLAFKKHKNSTPSQYRKELKL